MRGHGESETPSSEVRAQTKDDNGRRSDERHQEAEEGSDQGRNRWKVHYFLVVILFCPCLAALLLFDVPERSPTTVLSTLCSATATGIRRRIVPSFATYFSVSSRVVIVAPLVYFGI